MLSSTFSLSPLHSQSQTFSLWKPNIFILKEKSRFWVQLSNHRSASPRAQEGIQCTLFRCCLVLGKTPEDVYVPSNYQRNVGTELRIVKLPSPKPNILFSPSTHLSNSSRNRSTWTENQRLKNQAQKNTGRKKLFFSAIKQNF